MEQTRLLPFWMRGSPRSSSGGDCRSLNKASGSWASPWERREYIEHFLDAHVTCQAEFLQRIPLVKDLQRAWWLLILWGVLGQLLCSICRPGVLTPFLTRRSLPLLFRVGPSSCHVAFITRRGMRSTVRLRHAAHWASWADSSKVANERHPEVSTAILLAVGEQHTSQFHGSFPVCRPWKKRVSFLPIGNSWRRVQSKFQTSSTPMSPTSQERGVTDLDLGVVCVWDGRCGRAPILQWRPAGQRHHSGEPNPPRRNPWTQNAGCQRGRVATRSAKQRSDVPRVGWVRWPSEAYRVGRRGWGGGVSPQKQTSSSPAWRGWNQGMSDLLRRRANTAWTRRWSVSLSCAAAQAFASSLLDGRAFGGVDGETPNVQEVLATAKHLG